MAGERSKLLKEVRALAEAMARGDLDVRGNPGQLKGEAREVVLAVNGIVDSLVRPLRVAAGAIGQISTGVIPDFIIDDYQGEFNEIKKSVNTFLAVMYGMHHETQSLIQAVRQGKINTRGNDWDFNGVWRDLIAGLNQTLDAVLDPIQEAAKVLDRLAHYELCAEVVGRYKGDHARIKKSLNATAVALREAISQVSGSVAEVSAVGRKIADGSQVLAEGASVQVMTCREVSKSLECITDGARETSQSAEEAKKVSVKARAAADLAKRAMAEMTSVMESICRSTEDTGAILGEINGIALQTDQLAVEAAEEATKVGSSGRGFAVVAEEVRKLAARATEASDRMRTVIEKGRRGGLDEKKLTDGIREIELIAFQTKMLAFNAAVEAAHVSAASAGFESLTVEVHGLAQRSKDAAGRTENLISRALEMSREGATKAREIDELIRGSFEDAARVGRSVEAAALTAHQQTDEAEAAGEAMDKMLEISSRTEQESSHWFDLSEELARQMSSLQTLVNRFRLAS